MWKLMSFCLPRAHRAWPVARPVIAAAVIVTVVAGCSDDSITAPAGSMPDEGVMDTSGGSTTTSVKVWRASLYDLDGDGYGRADAAAGGEYVTLSLSTPLIIPDGYVAKLGDMNDGDPAIHPRQAEVFCNGLDDDCDGRTDETEFDYSCDGFDNDVDGFTMQVRINSPEVIEVWQQGQGRSDRVCSQMLTYAVEYNGLGGSSRGTRLTEPAVLAAMSVYPEEASTEIRLSGLSSGNVYRAKIHFYRRTFPMGASRDTPLGVESDWYYTTTDETSSSLGRTRTRIVLKGLYEFYLSEHLGFVGHDGLTYVDGTRYGADRGEWWCTEFYSTVCGWSVPVLTGQSNISGMTSVFESYDVFTRGGLSWTSTARRGDYLALDTNNDGTMNHSAMFLAYDDASGEVWTLEGNTGATFTVDDGGLPGREGCNEVFVKLRPASFVAGMGKIRSSML